MNKGKRITWRGINREHTGTVVGFRRCWAVVEMPNGKHSLVYDKETQKTSKTWYTQAFSAG